MLSILDCSKAEVNVSDCSRGMRVGETNHHYQTLSQALRSIGDIEEVYTISKQYETKRMFRM